MVNNQNHVHNHEIHLENIANSLAAHKFSTPCIQEVIDTLKWLTTSNIHLLNKQEQDLVSKIHNMREFTDKEEFGIYLDKIFSEDPDTYQKYRNALLKEKDYIIKLLERAITNNELSKEKMIKLQGTLLSNTALLKAFSTRIFLSVDNTDTDLRFIRGKAHFSKKYSS